MTITVLTIIVLFLCLFPTSNSTTYSGPIALRNRRVIQKSKGVLIISFLALLAAFRDSSIGNDTLNYINFFDEINQQPWNLLILYGNRFEMGYVYLNKVLSYISQNSQIILIFSSFFAYYFYGKFIVKYSPFISISILVFFFSRYHDDSMNIVRQVVATGFTIWGYLALKKNKNLYFIILMVCAFFMHKSSIVFALAYFVTRIEFKRSFLKYFVIICFITYVLGVSVVDYILNSGLVQSYYEDSEYLMDGKIAPLIQLVISILVFIFYLFNKGDKLQISENISSDITWMLMFSILLKIVGIYFAMMGRVAWYFQIFEWIAIPYALYNIQPQRRVLVSFVIISFFIIYYFVIFYYRPEWNMVYPYKFCF